jgi:sister chromatid cohesion PDS5-like protein
MNKLNQAVRTLSMKFPDSEKLIKFIHKFCSDLKQDKAMIKAMEIIVNPATDCEKSADSINTVLKNLGSPSSSNVYYHAIKTLLEGCSSVLVDKKAITVNKAK